MRRLLTLKYENVINYSRWLGAFRLASIVLAACILVGEVLIIYLWHGMPTSETASIWLGQFLLPTLAIYMALILMNILLRHFKSQPGAQAFTMVTAASLICFIMVCVHYIDTALYFIFVFPMLVSIVFVDLKPLVYAFILNTVLYALFIFLVLPASEYGEYLQYNFMNIITLVLLMLAAFVILFLILRIIIAFVEDIIEQKRKLQQDTFTGLYNHKTFEEMLERMLLEHRGNGGHVSLIMWDIDNFKNVNDTFGHDVGDQVILLFAAAMKKHATEIDTPFRYGGEEFAMLCRRSEESARGLAHQVRETFSRSTMGREFSKPLTACGGVCTHDNDLFPHHTVFFSATDMALYRAKAKPGKDAVVCWSEFKEVPDRRKRDRVQ